MKAIVIHQYGGPEQLKFEDYPDPVAGAGEVLLRVVATSVNPIDYKRRSQDGQGIIAPVRFPGIIRSGGRVSGTVVKLGAGVGGISRRPRVRDGDASVAEWCDVPAANLAGARRARPGGSRRMPLVTTTGNRGDLRRHGRRRGSPCWWPGPRAASGAGRSSPRRSAGAGDRRRVEAAVEEARGRPRGGAGRRNG